MKAKVCIKGCRTYDLADLEKAISECLDYLGGCSVFFKKGARVLLKPNLLTDAAPEEGITTHPRFVQAVARVLKRHGVDVAVADIPAEHRLEANSERVYLKTGMREIAEREGLRLLSGPKFVEEDGVIFSAWAREFDGLVSLPKFKTHSLTTLTGAVKNMFGLTPRLYRIHLHKTYVKSEDFARMLVQVWEKCRPALSIVDGIVGMEGNGPGHSGTVRDVGVVVASGDAFAADSVLARMMGLKPLDISTNKEGKRRGAGVVDVADIEIGGDAHLARAVPGFALPPASLLLRFPAWAVVFLNALAEFRPRVDRGKCNGCRICAENCPISAIDFPGRQARIDYAKCVDCFCCLEVCPIGAMKTKTGPLVRGLETLKVLKRWVDSFRVSAKRIRKEG